MEPFGAVASALAVVHLGIKVVKKFRQFHAEKHESRPEELDMVATEVEDLTQTLGKLQDIVAALPRRTREDQRRVRDAERVCRLILEPIQSMQATLDKHINDHPNDARRFQGALAVLSWTMAKPKLIWYRQAINTNYLVLKAMLGAFRCRQARRGNRHTNPPDSYPEMDM
jgi:hypothetical protein